VLAVTNARIYTAAGEVINKGTILVENGRFKAVGADIAIPDDAEIIDAKGRAVTPGLVEAHSHLSVFGLFDMEDMEGPGGGSDKAMLTGGLSPATTPGLDYYWAFNPRHDSLKTALNSGVTTVLTGPGSGKIISGLNLVAKTAGKTRSDMVLKYPAGVKMAFGENPKRNFGNRKMMPSTRMGNAALLREALIKAQNYMKKREKAEDEPASTNLHLEPLVKLLKGELVARFHAHRADDIRTIMRIADEFSFEFTLEHATETHKLLDEVVKRDPACVVGPTYGTRVKVETRDKSFATPGILERAGVSRIAITTDAPVVPIEHLRTSASLAYVEGMSEEGTLKAITLGAAEIAGVADRVGSIEVGKDADFVIMDGPPLEFTTRVEQVFVNGKREFDLSTHKEDWEKQ